MSVELDFPTWRNGSVIVLHAIGGGSIPPEGTRMVRTILYRREQEVQLGTTGKVPSSSVKAHWVGSIPTGLTNME